MQRTKGPAGGAILSAMAPVSLRLHRRMGPLVTVATVMIVMVALIASLLVPGASVRAETPHSKGAGVFGKPLLHEYVPLGPLRCENGQCRRDLVGEATATGMPDAIQTAGGLVSRPLAPPTPLRDEPVFEPQPLTPVVAGGGSPPSVGDPPPERRDRVHMDRVTDSEPPGTHVYHEVFNPAVYPFKRMTALDAVGADETLAVADRQLRPWPVLGVAAARAEGGRRDAFWGSAVLDLVPGRWIPLPSPGADLRLISYESDPEAELEFARDGADNVFVRAVTGQGGPGGPHRLVWLVDAPRSYVAGAVPEGLGLDDLPPLSVPVPAPVARRAGVVLGRIGIQKSWPFRRILDRLVEWFRGFEQGEIEQTSSSTYLDLALNRKGSCRHRSYAFTITALALGIPTRYIENELHVFVEVFLPGQGWRRINLGGAAVAQETRNMEGKMAYQNEGIDPFPQPEAYQQNSGIAPRSQGAGALGAGGAAGDRASSLGGFDSPDRESIDPSALLGTPSPGGAPQGPGDPIGHEQRAAGLPEVSIEIEKREAFRGEAVRVHGRIAEPEAHDARGRTTGRVAIELVGPRGLPVPLGDALPHPDGSFDLTVELPRGLPLGRYRVVGRPILTPGGAR